ncbi:ParB (plasmid) [Corynebacterium jeikeium K411]|uniref:ParB n=1 Tax=Corynebacterium jeikeium (strain K411) TaxID=306537 RepID=Q93MI9_CORJK|nr:hypothetical protein [Corynebacterium jeikeium]AAK94058.1 ParB [Corynebacterium jeikeium K411]
MAEKRAHLADTLSKGRVIKKTKPVPVADTFANKDVALDRRTTIYLSQDNWKALKLRSVEEDKNLSELINDLVADYLSAK